MAQQADGDQMNDTQRVISARNGFDGYDARQQRLQLQFRPSPPPPPPAGLEPRDELLLPLAENISLVLEQNPYAIVNVTREYPFDYALVMFGYLMPFILVVTLMTNFIVIVVLSRRHMRTPTNIVLMTMALVDVGTLASPSPWYLYIYTFGNHDKFLFPPATCYAHYVMTDVVPIFLHTSSIWLALLLASQRYIYVCHPTMARTWCTVPRVKRAIVWILLIAFLHQSSHFFDNIFKPTKIAHNGQIRDACRNEMADWVSEIGDGLYYLTYYTFRIFFVFIIPCVALLTLNILLFRALRRAEKKRTELFKSKFRLADQTAPGQAGGGGGGGGGGGARFNSATPNLKHFAGTFEASSYALAATLADQHSRRTGLATPTFGARNGLVGAAAAAAASDDSGSLEEELDEEASGASWAAAPFAEFGRRKLEFAAHSIDLESGRRRRRRQRPRPRPRRPRRRWQRSASRPNSSDWDSDSGSLEDSEPDSAAPDSAAEASELSEDESGSVSATGSDSCGHGNGDEDSSTCFECAATLSLERARNGAELAACRRCPAGAPLATTLCGTSSAAGQQAAPAEEPSESATREGPNKRPQQELELARHESAAASRPTSCDFRSAHSKALRRARLLGKSTLSRARGGECCRIELVRRFSESRRWRRRPEQSGEWPSSARQLDPTIGRPTTPLISTTFEPGGGDDGDQPTRLEDTCAGNLTLLGVVAGAGSADSLLQGRSRLQTSRATASGGSGTGGSDLLRRTSDTASRPAGHRAGRATKSPSFAGSLGRGSRATLVCSSLNGHQPAAQSGRTMDSNRTTLMLIVVVTVFLVVEVPVAAVTITHVVLNSFEMFRNVDLNSQLNYIKLFTNFFIMISYSINFTIYCSMSKKFRETFRDIFFCGAARNRKRGARRMMYQTQQQVSQYNNNNNNNNTATNQQQQHLFVLPPSRAINGPQKPLASNLAAPTGKRTIGGGGGLKLLAGSAMQSDCSTTALTALVTSRELVAAAASKRADGEPPRSAATRLASSPTSNLSNASAFSSSCSRSSSSSSPSSPSSSSSSSSSSTSSSSSSISMGSLKVAPVAGQAQRAPKTTATTPASLERRQFQPPMDFERAQVSGRAHFQPQPRPQECQL